MNQRRYAALAITPLRILGARCSALTGAGTVCTRWAQWSDTDEHQSLCTQHAHRTAQARTTDPARAAALAAAATPVTFTIVVEGDTAHVHRDGGPIGVLTVAQDGTFYGLDRIVSTP